MKVVDLVPWMSFGQLAIYSSSSFRPLRNICSRSEGVSIHRYTLINTQGSPAGDGEDAASPSAAYSYINKENEKNGLLSPQAVCLIFVFPACHPAFTCFLASPPVTSQLLSSLVSSQGIHPSRACPVILCVCCVRSFDKSDIRTKKFCHNFFFCMQRTPLSCPCPVSQESFLLPPWVIVGRLTLSLSLNPTIYAPVRPDLDLQFFMSWKIWRANGISGYHADGLADLQLAAGLLCDSVQLVLCICLSSLAQRSLCPAWPSSGARPPPPLVFLGTCCVCGNSDSQHGPILLHACRPVFIFTCLG